MTRKDCLKAVVPRRRIRAGTSLLEIMVVISVLGVLVGMTMPSYRRAIEQTRLDIAAAHLRTIWAAQRLYYLDHRAYASTFTALASDGLIDSAALAADRCYVYSIESGGSAFTASASRSGSGVFGGTLSIGMDGVVSGTVAGGSGIVLSPGFQ